MSGSPHFGGGSPGNDSSLLRSPNTVLSESSWLLSKKSLVILVIFAICILIALCINFINVHSDFEDLKDFYRGYMGRKLLISEGRLTSRQFLREYKRVRNLHPPTPTTLFQNGFIQNEERESNQIFSNTTSKRVSILTCEDQLYDISSYQDMDVTSLTTTTTQLFSTSTRTISTHHFNQHSKSEVNGPSNFETDVEEEEDDPEESVDETSALRQVVEDLLNDEVDRGILSSQWGTLRPDNFPINVSSFIEDNDPEWRDLDYATEVGELPTCFPEFIVQYDCRCFPKYLSDREQSRRKSLYHQFRKWKKRRRKLWNIVVTERAKKEMADQEKNGGGGRGGGRGGVEAGRVR